MPGPVAVTHAAVRLAANSEKPRLAPYVWIDGSSPSMTALGRAFCLAAMRFAAFEMRTSACLLRSILRALCARDPL